MAHLAAELSCVLRQIYWRWLEQELSDVAQPWCLFTQVTSAALCC